MRLEIIRNMPDLTISSNFANDKLIYFDPGTTIFSIPQLMEYAQENKIEFLVIEENIIQKHYPIFKDILSDRNQYIYLEEIFDSNDLDYKKFKAKIFKINWKIYNEL